MMRWVLLLDRENDWFLIRRNLRRKFVLDDFYSMPSSAKAPRNSADLMAIFW
jgi:hypothetical protein